MANTPVNIAGFETGDLSEVYGVTISGGNTVAASTLKARPGYGVYSCHLQNTTNGGQAQFNVGPISTTTALQITSGISLSFVSQRLYVYLVSVTNTAGNGSQLTPLLAFIGTSVAEASVFINSNKQLVYQDASGNFFAGLTVLPLNRWVRIDLTLNVSTNAYTVTLNNATELSGTQSGSTNVTAIQVGGTSSANFEYYVDDLWLDNTSRAPDGGTACYTATGNGALTGWVGTASSAVPPNATGALTSAADNDQRTVTTNASIPPNATVNAVTANCFVQPGTNLALLSTALHSGATTGNNASSALPVGVYSNLRDIFTTDPNTSAAWTVANANLAQAGVRDGTHGGTSSCEAIYLMVDFFVANSPVNIVGFETGDVSEIGSPTIDASGACAAVTTPVNTQAPSAFSCHVKLGTLSGQTFFTMPAIGNDGTLNTNPNISIGVVRAYFNLLTVTGTSGNGLQLTPLIVLFSQSNAFANWLTVNSSRNLVVKDAASAFHVGTTVLSLSTYYRIDFYLNSTTGAWAVKINNALEMSGTTTAAINNINSVQIGGQSSQLFEFYVDDVWLDSATYAPDGGVACFTALSTGSNAGWVGTASSAVPPNSAGALTSAVAADTRSVTLGAAINPGGSINAAKCLAYCKAASGTSGITPFIQSGNTTQVLGTTGSISTSSYQLLDMLVQNDPHTAAPWSVSAFNAAQPGVQNVVTGGGTDSCEAIYLMADFVGTTTPEILWGWDCPFYQVQQFIRRPPPMYRYSEQYTDYRLSSGLPGGQGIAAWQSSGDGRRWQPWRGETPNFVQPLNVISSAGPPGAFDQFSGSGDMMRRRSFRPEGQHYAEPVAATFIPGGNVVPLVPLSAQGNMMRRRYWRSEGQQYAEAVDAAFIPAVPPTLLAWDVSQRGRPAARPWIASAEFTSQPWLDLLNPGQGLPVYDKEQFWRADGTRLRAVMRAEQVRDFLFTPAGVTFETTLAWDAGQWARQRAAWHAADVPDLVPIWTFGTGQPAPLGSWGVGGDAILRPGRRTVANDAGSSPFVIGTADIGFTLIGWRDDPSPMRWRRPAFQAQEMVALPPVAISVDLTRVSAAVLAMQADLLRARSWRSVAVQDKTAPLWEALAIITDQLGYVVWDVPQPAIRTARRLSMGGDGATLTLGTPAVLPIPWAPIYDDGSRSQYQRPVWHSSKPDWDAPPWIAAGVIIVPGPYYVTAGQWYQAGAVDGFIETPE